MPVAMTLPPASFMMMLAVNASCATWLHVSGTFERHVNLASSSSHVLYANRTFSRYGI